MKKVISSKKKGRRTKWKDEFYLRAYQLAKCGKSNMEIAGIFDIPQPNFLRWIKKRPALAEALKRGRDEAKGKGGKGTQSFMQFVYGQLPPQLRRVWSKIDAVDCKSTKAAKILLKYPLKWRKHLFMYAYFSSNFNLSEACRKVGIARSTPSQWAENDPGFSELIQGIHQVKKDFYEDALVELVKKGDPGAIIFVNRTLNRDRGYHEKTTINVNGTIEHKHQVDELGLPQEVKKTILEAMRARKTAEQRALPLYGDSKEAKNIPATVDAEFQVKEKVK